MDLALPVSPRVPRHQLPGPEADEVVVVPHKEVEVGAEIEGRDDFMRRYGLDMRGAPAAEPPPVPIPMPELPPDGVAPDGTVAAAASA